jgi:DNA-binding transcriptional ArsR family regulator
VLRKMDLPTSLPAASAGIDNQVFRGAGGQLNEQAQAILAKLAKTFESCVTEIGGILDLPKQTRLPGLVAHISGISRTVVSRHLKEHLTGEDVHLRHPMNKGGRKRKHLDLPSDLPECDCDEGDVELLSMFQPLDEKFSGLRLHAAVPSIDLPSSSPASAAGSAEAEHGLTFSLNLGELLCLKGFVSAFFYFSIFIFGFNVFKTVRFLAKYAFGEQYDDAVFDMTYIRLRIYFATCVCSIC